MPVTTPHRQPSQSLLLPKYSIPGSSSSASAPKKHPVNAYTTATTTNPYHLHHDTNHVRNWSKVRAARYALVFCILSMSLLLVSVRHDSSLRLQGLDRSSLAEEGSETNETDRYPPQPIPPIYPLEHVKSNSNPQFDHGPKPGLPHPPAHDTSTFENEKEGQVFKPGQTLEDGQSNKQSQHEPPEQPSPHLPSLENGPVDDDSIPSSPPAPTTSTTITTSRLSNPPHVLPALPNDLLPTTVITTAGTRIVDNELTTTTFSSSTGEILSRVFKPLFFDRPLQAKVELSSFMATLESLRNDPLRHQQLLNQKEQHDSDSSNDYSSSKNNQDDSPDDSLVLEKFFGYLPMGGGNNQFSSLQKAALIAKDLDRTLVLPPIAPSSHIKVWSGPRYSAFYDLEEFTRLSGIPVVEWHDIKHVPSSTSQQLPRKFTKTWEEFSEPLPCVANGAIGLAKSSKKQKEVLEGKNPVLAQGDLNIYDHFRPQFLLKAEVSVLESDETQGRSTSYERTKGQLKAIDQFKMQADKNGADMWQCLTCPYFLQGQTLGVRMWDEVGLHLKFNQQFESMLDDLLDRILGPLPKMVERDNSQDDFSPAIAAAPDAPVAGALVTKEVRPDREHQFLMIHLRRGDIVTKCPKGVAEIDCIVQIEQIAVTVQQLQEERQRKAKALGQRVEPLPVLVATNEKRPSELAKVDALGWVLLGHDDPVATDENDKNLSEIQKRGRGLGTMTQYGPFYPPMLDAGLLTKATIMIGMKASRMSGLAAQRGREWYGHKTMLL